MDAEKGNLSISTENIFPIIKKWLYSEKDIFIRELIANASDAIAKMRRVVSLGEAEDDGASWRIGVTVDKDAKTIAITDNGIGMTDEEVRKYINQIAFSGAAEFLEKYKDKAEDAQIIGHFGLGFYSAFMVSAKVQIDTLSWQKGAQAVRWVSDGLGEYEMEPSDRAMRGTTVTLSVSSDEAEFVDKWKVREALVKYFRFLPYEIYLTDAAEDRKKAKEKEKEGEGEEPIVQKPVNDINPLWNKPAKDCAEEEYKKFYREVFSDYAEPLFWVHLNIDYPFQLKGILYFPRLKNEFDTIEGQVKLYCNQVFVADNIKEVIPEYLLLLKGCIDCPDLPLNVSRSFLQNDGTVKKLSGHITKKVGDKLTGMFENERETYCKYWDSINPFIKFGCMRDEKFYDRMKDAIVFKTINDDYKTAKEYLDEFAKAEEAQEPDWDEDDNAEEEKTGKPRMKTVKRKIVYYVSDARQQAQYISMFQAHGLNAVVLNTLIDSHFITFLEMKLADTRFKRIDSDLTDAVKGENSAISKEDADALADAVKAVDGKIKVKLEHLKETGAPAIVLLSEESRRMQEMSKLYAGMDMGGMSEFPADETLVLNADHALVKKLAKLALEESKKEEATLLAAQIHDLAMLSHGPLEPEALAKFLERSAKILEKLG